MIIPRFIIRPRQRDRPVQSHSQSFAMSQGGFHSHGPMGHADCGGMGGNGKGGMTKSDRNYHGDMDEFIHCTVAREQQNPNTGDGMGKGEKRKSTNENSRMITWGGPFFESKHGKFLVGWYHIMFWLEKGITKGKEVKHSGCGVRSRQARDMDPAY